MNEGRDREAKRTAFARANAFLRHVILLILRNHRLDSVTLSPMQALDINKVPAADLMTAHSVQAQLETTATNPKIVLLFLSIVSPEPGKVYSPVGLHSEFVRLTREELGLPPLALPADRCFTVNLECNLILPKFGAMDLLPK
jgi:hypothetical protein